MVGKEATGRKHRDARSRSTEAAFRARVRYWADKIGAQPKQVHLRVMTRKWGSSSTAGRVTFDTGLLRRDRVFSDFVIVHELLHLLVPNHGKLFKSLLSAYVPGWERLAKLK